MKNIITFAASFLFCASGYADICGGRPNNIEPDMRITEAHLTSQAARAAKGFLSKHGDSRNDDYEYGRMNSKKIIEGYKLKQAAENGGDEEISSFCRWLAKDGFWYD